jgi:Tol biopolymer transport system component
MLSPGARLGPYEVVSAIGAGGMGEVWRARDTRLEREVAIKILPSELAHSAQLRARFDREAKAISALNHPHICTLHDVGHENGVDYLVMELLVGESLADRLANGPLPLEQVLRFGGQIATALDAAHRQGIVHRDLKPGNIMITRSGAKLLDFGLARTAQDAKPIDMVTQGLTEARPLTQEGAILGTFQYMAPEQLEGLQADARTDIFALGAVLYEMATGRRAFAGKTKTSLIAAIVSTHPEPISSITAMAPAALDHVVRKCLEKDPDERWQSARDVASELRWIGEGKSTASDGPPGRSRPRTWMLGAGALWLASLAAAAWLGSRRVGNDIAEVPFRADVALPRHAAITSAISGPIALSPSASRLAYVTHANTLAVHDFESGQTRLLEGTNDASFPFWSPDGMWIAFFAQGKIKKVAATGGPVQVICDALSGRGGSWNRKGTIVFSADVVGPLMRVAAGGGTPVAVTRVAGERWTHRHPHFLPDDEHFLLTARDSTRQLYGTLGVGSLRSAEVKEILPRASNAQYADGQLFFIRDGNLVAQPFDMRTLTVTGSGIPLAERIEYFNARDVGNFSVSAGGMLAYQQELVRRRQLAWVDAAGREVSTVGDPATYVRGRLSVDGSITALGRRDEEGESVWVMDMQRGIVSRVMTQATTGILGVTPHPSGKQLAVTSSTGFGRGENGVWIQSAFEQGIGQRLTTRRFTVTDWSSDGSVLVGGSQEPGTGFDVLWLSLQKPNDVHAFAQTPAQEQGARLSPDGRWIAYASNETGNWETFVADFPRGQRRWQVTRAGGRPLQWSADGRELFYGAGTIVGPIVGPLAAVSIADRGDGTIEIGASRSIPLPAPNANVVAVHGDRVLILKDVSDAPDEPIRLIRNWRALVTRDQASSR